MPPRLSHWLAPLAVKGNRIIEAGSGRPILLRGINRSGLEYSSPGGEGSLAKAGITEAEIHEIIVNWRANIIRLPINQQWALRREEYNPELYLAGIDSVVELAARRGAYTLIDLHWLDATTIRGHNSDGSVNFVPALPTTESIVLWKQLAERYRDEPAVLYDIFNEPHDPLPDDDVPLFRAAEDGSIQTLDSKQVTALDWQHWATLLVDAIREENPRALIFVPGTDWAYDLSAHPLPWRRGLVYSSHVYRNKGLTWESAFGQLSRSEPVFVGEWGGTDVDVDWGRALADYLRTLKLGWTAWSWSDSPRIVEPSESGFEPTPFGRLVQEQLLS